MKTSFSIFPKNFQQYSVEKKIANSLMIHHIVCRSPSNQFTKGSCEPNRLQALTKTQVRKKHEIFDCFPNKSQPKISQINERQKILANYHIKKLLFHRLDNNSTPPKR